MVLQVVSGKHGFKQPVAAVLAKMVISTGEKQANLRLTEADGLVAMSIQGMWQEQGLGFGAHLPEKRRVLSANEMEGGVVATHGTLHAAILPESQGVAHDLRQGERSEVLAQHAMVIERLAVGHGGDARNVGEEPSEVRYLLAVDPHLVGRISEDLCVRRCAKPNVARQRIAHDDTQHGQVELEHPRHPPWPPHDVYSHAEGALRLLHAGSGNVIYIVAPHLERCLVASSLYEMVGQRRSRPTVIERRGGKSY